MKAENCTLCQRSQQLTEHHIPNWVWRTAVVHWMLLCAPEKKEKGKEMKEKEWKGLHGYVLESWLQFN